MPTLSQTTYASRFSTPMYSVALLLSLSLFLSACDEIKEATAPNTQPASPETPAPSRQETLPYCPESAYTDDSVAVTSTTPGSTIQWQRRDGITNSPIQNYTGPIPVIDGAIYIRSIGPAGDTTLWNPCISYLKTDSTLKTPTISPESDRFDYATDSATISDSSPGVTIHYTIDGSIPTKDSPVYKHGIPLKVAVLVRAIAFADGWHPSQPASRLFLSETAPWNTSIHYDTIVDSRDNQAYPVLKLGTQIWMAKNLNYRPAHSTSGDTWGVDARYGTWYTSPLVREGNLCPEGWTIPDTMDWRRLADWTRNQPRNAYAPGEYVDTSDWGRSLRATEAWSKMDGSAMYMQYGYDTYGFRLLPSSVVSIWGMDGFRSKGAALWTSDTSSIGKGIFLLHPWSTEFLDSLHETSRPPKVYVRCLKAAP